MQEIEKSNIKLWLSSTAVIERILQSGLEAFTQSTKSEILEDLNIYRKANGLSELQPLAEGSIESEDHNYYMIDAGAVSHDNFSDRASYLMNAVGASKVGENVGYGYRTSEAVINAWLKSRGHKDNIEGNYTHFGISVRQDAEGKNYFTNIFVKK